MIQYKKIEINPPNEYKEKTQSYNRKMMNRTETIMRNKMESYGWCRVNNTHRSIRIGFQSNCNEDGIIVDPNLKTKLEHVLQKYNVSNYKLTPTTNKWEHSYEVCVTNEEYAKLQNEMLMTQ